MKLHLFASCVVVALLGAACSPDVATQKRRFREAADTAAAAGDHASAAQALRNVVRLDPNDGAARTALAQEYLALGQGAQALAEAARAADLLPKDATAQVEASRLLLVAGQFEDAAARAKQALDIDARNQDALLVLGYASARLRDSAGALKVVQEAVKSGPTDPRTQVALAALYRTRGELEAAESAFKNAVRVAPKSPPVHIALANFYLGTGRPAEAEATLKAAVAFDDAVSHDVTKALVGLYLGASRDADAEPLLVSLMQSKVEPEYRIALGDIYVRRRDYAKAIDAYTPLAADKAVGPAAIARMASAEFSAGKREDAYRRVKEALVSSPINVELLAAHARFLLQDRRFAEAENEARSVLAQDPDRFEGLYTLGAALIELGFSSEAQQYMSQAASARPRAALPKVQLGRLALSRGEPQAAQRFAEEALQLEPSSAFARLLLVRSAVAQGKTDRAEASLAPLLASLDDSPDIHALQGDTALARRDFAAARQAYERALALAPHSADAVQGMVRVAFANKRSDEAIALVRQHVTDGTKDPALLSLGARALALAGDTAGAEALFKRTLDAAPDRLETYVNLARFYVSNKRLDDALAQFQTAATKRPDATDVRTFVGVVQQLQGKPREAQATYETLLQQKPDAAIAANNLAMLLLESGGNVDVALSHAQTAKRVLPHDPDVNDTLGLVYMKKNLAAQAVAAFAQALQARPDRTDLWLHLGQARAQVGNASGAQEAFAKVLALEPRGTNAGPARAGLKSLEKPSQ